MPTRAATAGFPLHLSEVIEQELAVLAPDDAAGPDGQPPWDFAADQVRQDTLPGLLARLRKPGDEVCARLRDHLSPAFRELLERQGEEDGATEEALRDGLVEELNHCLREDYLSTVSGGGYLGGLLSAWIHRHPRGLAGVSDELAGRQVVVRRPVRRHQPHRLERPRGPGAGARARTAAGEAARDPVPDPRRHDRQRPPRLVARQRVAVESYRMLGSHAIDAICKAAPGEAEIAGLAGLFACSRRHAGVEAVEVRKGLAIAEPPASGEPERQSAA